MHAQTTKRAIPSVERLVSALRATALPRPILIALTRSHLNALRAGDSVPSFSEIVKCISKELCDVERERLQHVINATGIVLHTNLGRSPLSAQSLRAIEQVAKGYCNLEFQIARGQRGQRGAYLERCLKTLFGCSGIAIVNNCAAALMLILKHITSTGKSEVVISRGELLQIGGGFRIPEILQSSGAQMREIGTTNHTSLRDYEQALTNETGLILVIHRSNFRMDGFVKSPKFHEIIALGKSHKVPVVFDQGSGAMIKMRNDCGFENEMTVKELIDLGFDLVCLSGDKLLGGPQSGLICGDAKFISKLKMHPIYRAVRCDKLILAGLQATAESHLKGMAEVNASIPIYQKISQNRTKLRHRAEAIVKGYSGKLLQIELTETLVEMGGGTLPQSQIPSLALALQSDRIDAQSIARLLREGQPPVIAYVKGGRCCLDLKTVFEEEDARILSRLQSLQNNQAKLVET